MKNVKINVKPISVNEAWQGRRFKTEKYIRYEKAVMLCLPKIVIPEPPFELYLKFGFSSKASDWDNCIKTTQDILAKKYGFNDKMIRRGIVETEIVPKGQEYFEFKIESFTNTYNRNG